MAAVVVDLSGSWRFKEFPCEARRMRDLDGGDWLDTDVPCSIYGSLIGAGVIEREALDAEPETLGWVSEKAWVYRKVFDAPAELLESDRAELIFEGLDTITGVWLNDKLLGRTANMFVAHRFDVAEHLKATGNTLTVKFEPAVAEAMRLMNRYTAFKDAEFDNPHRVYVRKAQYQFGWDFCPGLPGCGIFRPVRLEGVRSARIADVHVRTIDLAEDAADLRVAVAVDAAVDAEYSAVIHVTGPGFATTHFMNFADGQNPHATVFRISNPQLWWPAGYGGQPFYMIEVELKRGEQVVDTLSRRFAVRTIRVDMLADGRGQGRFAFVVNGTTVYVRGANWAPATMMPGTMRDADYERLVHAAGRANFNMLRVWGGGYYEDERFYELCDELGIMVWQDFMFACAYYPDRQWFMEMVEAEATAVIERLRNHPCIALWCGNNEIDWLHAAGLLGKGRKFYGKAIYHQLLPRLVAQLDQDTCYIPSTPLGQEETFATLGRFNSDRTLSKPARRPKVVSRPLTSHRWDVWSGHEPIRRYLCEEADVSPFVTEFGLQSMPAAESIARFCRGEGADLWSRGIEKHNYQVDGNSRLSRYISTLFAPTTHLERFAYYSQVMQARAVKTHVEFLRRSGRNNGVLFWQFNEPAAAISWSAIDSTARPKALYYYARRFFAGALATLVTGRSEPSGGLEPQLRCESAVIVNETSRNLTGKLVCRLVNLSGRELDRISFPVSLGPFSVSRPSKLPRAFTDPVEPADSALQIALLADGERLAENFYFYLPDKHLALPKTRVTSSLERLSEKSFELSLSADAVVADLCVTVAGRAR